MYFASARPWIGNGCLTDNLFNKFWNVADDWVEEPNRRRGGISGVIRTTYNYEVIYIKKQVGHIYRNFRHPFGRPTILREFEALQVATQLHIAVPQALYCESRWTGGQRRTLLVTKELYGYSPLDAIADTGQSMSAADRSSIINAIAQTLAKLHQERWQHGCLYPKHIYLKKQPEGYVAALLDLEKMRRRSTVKQASRHDLAKLKRYVSSWDDGDWTLFMERYHDLISSPRPS